MVGYKGERMFTALAAAAERRIWDLKSQEFANAVWAFATVSHKDEQLFTALARDAEQRSGDLNPQELANLA